MIRLRIPAPYDADVVIAGAGPAGASAAARLAAAGTRVLLLDQQTFPRDKVCGDFVGPMAVAELEALGVTRRPEYGSTNIIRRAALFLDGRELIARQLPAVHALPAYGRCIPRFLLDQWILEAARDAGAHLLDGTRVRGFQLQDDAIIVDAVRRRAPLRLRARLLIGADGSSSVIARRLRGTQPDSANRIIAVRAYYENVQGPEDRCDLFFSAASFPGYYWLFPTAGTTANVGLGMALQTMPPTEDHLRDLLLSLVARDPALAERLSTASLRGKVTGWPLTTYDDRLPLVSDRVVLIGDAAGLINPLNGEGIQYALASGRWAAEAAVGCLAGDDLSVAALGAYAERVEREMRYDMALAGLVVQLIRNRHLTRVWLEALKVITTRARSDDDYARITGGILAGLSPSREALSLKVVGRTLDQALYSTVLALAWSALKGPAQLTRQGAGIVQALARATTAMLSDPAVLADWMVGVGRHGTELALQFGRHLGQDPPAPEPVPPLVGAPVRVALPRQAPVTS